MYMSKYKKIIIRLDDIEWKLNNRTFVECLNFEGGALNSRSFYRIDELVKLILDHLGLEPDKQPQKTILRKKK